MLEKVKDTFGKVDKPALGMAVGLMVMSWAALPIVYFLLVRKKRRENETKKSVDENKKDVGATTEMAEDLEK